MFNYVIKFFNLDDQFSGILSINNILGHYPWFFKFRLFLILEMRHVKKYLRDSVPPFLECLRRRGKRRWRWKGPKLT